MMKKTMKGMKVVRRANRGRTSKIMEEDRKFRSGLLQIVSDFLFFETMMVLTAIDFYWAMCAYQSWGMPALQRPQGSM